MRSLRRIAAIAGLVGLATSSTASLAAGNGTAYAALGAAAAAAQPSPAVNNSEGLPGGTGFFPGGAVLPVGIAIAAAILAVVLATKGNRGQGRGFSPN